MLGFKRGLEVAKQVVDRAAYATLPDAYKPSAN